MNNDAGWIEAQSHGDIDFDLKTFPLLVKTDSPLGSDEFMKIVFKDYQGTPAGEFEVSFRSNPQYYLHSCFTPGSWHNFSTALSSAEDSVRVWQIRRTKTSMGRRLIVHCNDVEVLNLVISNLTCSSYYSSAIWSRDTAKISFQNSATVYYKPGKH